MDDLISRWEAINALERKKDKNANGDVGGFYNRIIQNDIDTLMQLPSAQPELAQDLPNACTDAISRQAAIDKINERQRMLIYCFGFENDAVKIMDIENG